MIRCRFNQVKGITQPIARLACLATFLGSALPSVAAPPASNTTQPLPPGSASPSLTPGTTSPQSFPQTPGVAPQQSFPPTTPGVTTPGMPIPSAMPAAPAVPVAITDGGYVLGPGDRLRVDIFGMEEYRSEPQVLADGTVSVPLVGRVDLQGLSIDQATTELTKKYAKYIKRPVITLTVTAARPLRITVAGEVERASLYPIPNDRPTTVTGALQLAGGIKQSANVSQVQVRRPQPKGGQPQVMTLDLWKLIDEGDTSQDPLLRDGDVVVVPPATDFDVERGRRIATSTLVAQTPRPINVLISGEVFRPGPYTLGAGGQGTVASGQGTTGQTAGLDLRDTIPTLSKAIQLAGGIRDSANIRQVQVTRRTTKGNLTTTLDMWKLIASSDTQQDIALQDGDVVSIPKATTPLTAEESRILSTASLSPATITVNIVGEVQRPGPVQVQPNTPLNQAILSAGGFNDKSTKAGVQLVRLNDNGSVTRQTLDVDLSKGIDDKGNPLLKNNDTVVVAKSALTKTTDGVGRVIGPVGGFLGFLRLFGI